MTLLDLCYLPAREVLLRFANGRLTPSAYLDALIARTEAVNPQINAYTETFFDAAREAACKAEERYATGTNRALKGLPVAIKDAQRVAGQRRRKAPTRLSRTLKRSPTP